MAGQTLLVECLELLSSTVNSKKAQIIQHGCKDMAWFSPWYLREFKQYPITLRFTDREHP